MMIFNSFISVSGFNFGHTNNRLAVMFSCQQKNFEGICLALQWGHSKLRILSVHKTVL